MFTSHYLYLPIDLSVLETVVKSHQDEFNILLKDNFTEEELVTLESKLDSIAALYVQPVLAELQFSDFCPNPQEEEAQREFFGSCKSTIVLENLPYLETNPFQVTYLLELLKRFDEVLVDRGGVTELTFKNAYINELVKYKTIDSLLSGRPVKTVEIRTSSMPVDPIDFLVLDVYKELTRLSGKRLPFDELSPKVGKIYSVMKDERLDPTSLFRKIGLNAKDFDDGLERLKFWLRKQ